MNQFTERYKLYSNAELLQVIENSSDYQPEAVETAKNEIKQRKLTYDELSEARSVLAAKHQEKITQIEKRQEIESKIKGFIVSIANTMNPIKKSTLSTDRHIKLIALVFLGLSVYQFYDEFGMIEFMFGNNGGEWDFSMALYMAIIFLVPVAAILFWFKKKTGWILLGAYITFTAVNSIGLLINTLIVGSFGARAFYDFLPETSPLTYTLTFLFFAGTMWLIGKKNVREVFGISKRDLIMTVGIVSLLAIVSFAPYL